MYTIDFTGVIAVALVALVLVFIRISWTLKEICDAIASRGTFAAMGSSGSAAGAETASSIKASVDARNAAPAEAGIDEIEIAAVIAVASAAIRGAV